MMIKGFYTTDTIAGVNANSLPIRVDTTGNLQSVEQFKSGAEDNSNNVIAVVNRPLAVANYTPSVYTNYGAAATSNAKASAGNALWLYCENLNVAARYAQLHNTATTPGGGAVPLLSFKVPASSSIIVDLQAFGVNFSTGIAFGFSTTAGTYTAGVSTDVNAHLLYK